MEYLEPVELLAQLDGELGNDTLVQQLASDLSDDELNAWKQLYELLAATAGGGKLDRRQRDDLRNIASILKITTTDLERLQQAVGQHLKNQQRAAGDLDAVKQERAKLDTKLAAAQVKLQTIITAYQQNHIMPILPALRECEIEISAITAARGEVARFEAEHPEFRGRRKPAPPKPPTLLELQIRGAEGPMHMAALSFLYSARADSATAMKRLTDPQKAEVCNAVSYFYLKDDQGLHMNDGIRSWPTGVEGVAKQRAKSLLAAVLKIFADRKERGIAGTTARTYVEDYTYIKLSYQDWFILHGAEQRGWVRLPDEVAGLRHVFDGTTGTITVLSPHAGGDGDVAQIV